MNEVTVIVGVRPSTESPDLVLVQRRLGVVDGKLEFVGEPTESKVPLGVPRAEIHLSVSEDMDIGIGLVSQVENTGFFPVDVTKVMFEVATPDHTKPAFELIPRDQSKLGHLMPSESRDWVLPINSFGLALEHIGNLAPSQCKIVAYTGETVIAEAPGEQIRPVLELMWRQWEAGGGFRMTRALQYRFKAMDAKIRSSIGQAIQDLQKKPVTEWATTPGVIEVSDRMYFLTVPPDYRVLIRLHRQDGRQVELLDVLRQAVEEGVAAGQQG